LSLPLIIHKDGTIYFYRKFSASDEIEISNYLKKTTVQVQYTDKIEVYKIEDYSIASLLLMGDEYKNEFIRFLNRYSYNEIPYVLIEHLEEIEKDLKVVSLTLSKAEIIIRIMKGDPSFLEEDKKIKDKLKPCSEEKLYTYPRTDNFKLIERLAEKDVNITFPTIDTDGTVDFEFKEGINLRYYQTQAFDALVHMRRGLAVMPVGSGKTYVAIKLIQYFKRVTLILCENKHNCLRWKEMLLKYLDISNKDISVFINDSNINKISKINIYTYDIIRTTKDNSIFERLFENNWGVIIYDNAHKVVTEKAADLLYLKSTYKFALDSTLSRNDRMERSILNLFGGITYNISSDELVTNLYQKRLECYKIDLRNSDLSKFQFIKYVLKKNKERNILVVSYEKDDMEKIRASLGIRIINGDTGDTERINWVDDFNNCRLKKLCIGKLIDNYPITNVDVMIAAGYRGGTEIEDSFRIGTLVSTPSRLDKTTKSLMYYLINSDSDEKKVKSKEQYLYKWKVSLETLDANKLLGDDNFEFEG